MQYCLANKSGKQTHIAKHGLLGIGLLLLLQGALPGTANGANSVMDDCNLYSSPFDRRVCAETRIRHQAFALIPYKPTYFIVSRVDDLHQENDTYEDYETKFQISFKVPLTKQHPDTRWLLYFGYTQLSVWQTFNFAHSAPFRDTNFEPELMLYRLTNTDLFGLMKLRMINFGLVDHQSNGQSPPDSRSWNRSYIELILERDRNYLAFKLWRRWHETPKKNPNDYVGDDNPDIEEYVGNGELRFLHVGENNNVGLTWRDNLHHKGRGSIQFDWTFPVSEKEGLRFYIQYYRGYGETLIDYNIKRERIGFGLMLADWL